MVLPEKIKVLPAFTFENNGFDLIFLPRKIRLFHGFGLGKS